MDTPTTVPASYRLRRIVPPYKPARTPYVGKTVAWSDRWGTETVVVIREATGYDHHNKYWVAPLLPDGTFGAMTTATIGKEELQA